VARSTEIRTELGIDEVDDRYNSADVSVYVSHLDGYSNAALEAQTTELPLVANDAHEMREQITVAETGVLVAPG